MDENFKVIIIGAGLSGLAIAHGLQKNSIPFTIHERDPTPRPRSWGVTISWSHPSLALLLPESLYARLPETQPDPTLDCKARGCENVMLRDGATGEVMVRPEFPGIRRVNLQKWRGVMGADIDVKFGRSLVGVSVEDEGGVTASFADDTKVQGSVLVGTDGGSSVVRSILLPSPLCDPEVLPYEFLNFPVQYTAEQALWMDKEMHPIVDVGIHPKSMYIGIFLLDKPDLDRPESWVFYILATWPKEDGVTYTRDEDMLPELRRRMGGWADPYKSAVEWVKDGTRVGIVPGGLRVWAPRVAWDNRRGRVTLGGDAAHSMTFHRGQGGNNALRDAERFVSAMVDVRDGKKTLKQAVDEYDEDVRTRGVQEVDVSTVQTHATHDHKAYKQSPVAKHGIRPTIDIDKHKEKEKE